MLVNSYFYKNENMARYFFILILLSGIINTAQLQERMPEYEEVVRTFFTNYKKDDNSLISFAKKKDGWFVKTTNYLDSSTNDQVFWDFKSGSYYQLNEFEAADEEEDLEKVVVDYFYENSYSNYPFERCLYYGYNGWAEDVIDELRNEKILSDTMLESLARAYSSYANGFLFQTLGYSAHKNLMIQEDYNSVEHPDHRALNYFELPSDNRIKLALKYIDSSILVWTKLAKQNPKYETLVGNPEMKIFNEFMYGYHSMLISDKKEEAKNLINKIKFDLSIETLAKKYLDACPPNTILFTFGDNDTYPLWYLQEKSKYRKDVTVINTSLLSMPTYIDYLKKDKLVSFRATENIYGKEEYSYAMFKEDEKINPDRPISLSELLNVIYNKKYNEVTNDSRIYYPYKQVVLIINQNEFSKISGQSKLSSFFNFPIGNVLFLNTLIQLDIVETNINSRPILFTNSEILFSTSLQSNGITFQLLPINSDDSISIESTIKDIEKNLNTNISSLSINLKGAISASSYTDDSIFDQYNTLIQYYLNKNDRAKALKLTSEALLFYDKINIQPSEAAIEFAELLVNQDKKESASKVLHKLTNAITDYWIYPSALKFNLNKSYTEYLFNKIKKIIKNNALPKYNSN